MNACFHCALPIPAGVRLSATIDGHVRAMCCAGCVAVAELISANGLGDYYRYRDQPGANPEQAAAMLDDLLRYDHAGLQRSFVRTGAGSLRRCTLSIEGMRCAACAWLIERRLRSCAGVAELEVHLASSRAELAWDDSRTHLSAVLGEIAKLGYAARPYRPDWQEAARESEYRAALRRLVVAGLGAMQVMMFAVGLYAGALEGIEDRYRMFLRVVSGLVATPILAYSARPFFTSALRDLRNRRLGMDVPVALALAVAWSASVYATALQTGEVYFDSVAMFVFFLSVGRFIEMRARHHAAEAVEAALRTPPETATRLLEDDASEVVAVHELAPGDRVLVRPGESFPVDGVVRRGRGWVNESMLTGEHWPRDRHEGDEVAAGTQNGESPLVVEALRTGADTALSEVVRLVDRAGSEKPRVARLADRVAHVFVPAVLFASIGTALVWWTIDPARAFWVALSVLVITCPCALSLATPAALTAASAGALGRGLLLRSGTALETLQRVTHVVFDKTGTLTLGRFRLRRTEQLGGESSARCLAFATALERYSEHPIARAFDDSAATVIEVADVTARAGAGIEGRIGGRKLRIGTRAFVSQISKAVRDAGGDSHGVFLGDESGLLCRFELEDETRPGALEGIATLRARGIRVSVVSGDSRPVVDALAGRLGADHALASCTPQQKLDYVRDLEARGEVVLVVGDGVNDAPVLGAAQVSIAMGGGTDLARGSADAVLLTESLGPVADSIELATRARRVMRENLGWSLTYNLLALPLACSGLVTPWWAAIGMSLSSLVVVLNAVRLGRPPRSTTRESEPERPGVFAEQIARAGHGAPA